MDAATGKGSFELNVKGSEGRVIGKGGETIRYIEVGRDGVCSPRHPLRCDPSFIELSTASVWKRKTHPHE